MSNNHKTVINLIKSISGQANVLTIPRIFIDLTGDLKAALFLSQCVYWSDRGKRPDGSFYKTHEEWKEETGLTRHEVDRCREKVADFVTTEIHRANSKPTVHYYVNVIAIASAIGVMLSAPVLPESVKTEMTESVKTDLPESDKPLTETTHRLHNKKEDDDDISDMYFETFGNSITPAQRKIINGWVSIYGLPGVRDALEKTAERNGRSMKYTEAILQNEKRGKPGRRGKQEKAKDYANSEYAELYVN